MTEAKKRLWRIVRRQERKVMGLSRQKEKERKGIRKLLKVQSERKKIED